MALGKLNDVVKKTYKDNQQPNSFNNKMNAVQRLDVNRLIKIGSRYSLDPLEKVFYYRIILTIY